MKKSTPEKYHSILLPRHHLGQKRRVFDTNYLSTLHRENVLLTNDPISHLTSTSVVTSSGNHYPADIIILANGFHTQSFILPMTFSNTTRGITLDSAHDTGVWRTTGPEAYLGFPLPSSRAKMCRLLRLRLPKPLPVNGPQHRHRSPQRNLHVRMCHKLQHPHRPHSPNLPRRFHRNTPCRTETGKRMDSAEIARVDLDKG